MNNPDEGSYANPGVVVSGQAGWYFAKYWGAGLHFGEQLHPLDENGVVANKLVEDPFLENYS